jgi:creatinine amidohydrolase
MAHAGEFETAMYQYLKPELVDMRLATEPETPSRLNQYMFDDLFGSGPVHMVNRWSRVTESGIEGDPKLATPEKGKAFAEASIRNLIEFCRLFREYTTPPDRDFNHQI